MFNLLDTQSKKEVHKTYILRRSIVMLCMAIFLYILFIISLVPTVYTVYVQRETQMFELNSLKSSGASKNVNFTESVIGSTNRILELFHKHVEKQAVTPILFSVLQKKTSAITWKSIQYQSIGTPVLVIEGTAKTREDLLGFLKSLQSSGEFEKVDLPISNFAKNRDIPFNLTLTLKKSNE